MKALSLSVAFEIASTLAFAQGADGPMANLRACSMLEREQRLECLDRLSRDIAPLDQTVRSGGDWIISETTSPVDYTPIVTAVAHSRSSSDGRSMQLSIQCRGGRTELVVPAPALPGGGADYSISYRVNDGPPVQLAAGTPSSGAGAAFRGDAVRLLQSLPDEGQITVRVSNRSGAALEGQFLLGGLRTARERMAAACKWPRAVAGPRN